LVRGLAANPAERWPDMQTLLRELDAALAPPRRSYAPLLLATVIAMASIAAGVVIFSHDRSAAAADDCGPPEAVFGSAWSHERRKAVVASHKRDIEGMAAVAALDEIRTKWIESYTAACAMAPSAARHERLGCLLEVRDDTNELTEPLEDADEKLSIGAVIPLTVAMGMCGVSEALDRSIPAVPAAPGAPAAPAIPGHPADPWDPGPRGPGHPRPPNPPRPPRPSRDSPPPPPPAPSGE
ncbi:MAG TPA: hypothetical protein VGD80_22535, partial [Kofleriaceae bacterium]